MTSARISRIVVDHGDSGRTTLVRTLPQHLLLVLDIADEPLLLVQPDGLVLGANAAMASHLKITVENLPGCLLFEWVESAHDDARRLLHRAASSRQLTHGDISLRNPEGEILHGRASGKLVEPAAAEPAILTFCFREAASSLSELSRKLDTAAADHLELRRLNWALAAFAVVLDEDRRELKAAEEARQLAEATLRRERDFSDALIRSLPGVLYMYDEDYRFLRWNENFERVVGRSGGEIQTMGPLDFFSGDDKERVRAAVGDVFAKGAATVEAHFTTRDGGSVPFYFTGVSVEFDAKRCLVGIGIDFTERKLAEAASQASEARYRTLFDYAPDGIIIADPSGVYLDANPSLCRMLDYGRDELIGLSAGDIVVETEVEHIEPALQQINAALDYHREWTFRRKDGSTFPAEVVATLMPDGAVLAMVRDIAERKRAETGRRAAEGALRDVQAEMARFARVSTLGEFAATIAHEVSQPLAAIVTNSDAAIRWLAATPPNLDRAREALNRSIRDSTRAHEVIKRTRAFVARGESDYGAVDLNEAINEVLLLTRREQQKARVVVQRDLSAQLPKVRGNRIELQQVVLNLVLNAIDAMRSVEDRDHILRISTGLDDAGAALVSVQDSGEGLAPETAERLFEHFFTTKAEGTGLGLAICRSIVEAHGGRLWVEPALPFGARFQFTVPAFT